jgi:hypothetical protein
MRKYGPPDVLKKAPLPHAPRGQDSFHAAGTCDNGIDLVPVVDDDEAGRHGRSAVGEVKRECASAVRVHSISAGRGSMRKVGDDLAVNRDGIDLAEVSLAIELCHGDADLLAGRAHPAQLSALHGEAESQER